MAQNLFGTSLAEVQKAAFEAQEKRRQQAGLMAGQNSQSPALASGLGQAFYQMASTMGSGGRLSVAEQLAAAQEAKSKEIQAIFADPNGTREEKLAVADQLVNSGNKFGAEVGQYYAKRLRDSAGDALSIEQKQLQVSALKSSQAATTAKKEALRKLVKASEGVDFQDPIQVQSLWELARAGNLKEQTDMLQKRLDGLKPSDVNVQSKNLRFPDGTETGGYFDTQAGQYYYVNNGVKTPAPEGTTTYTSESNNMLSTGAIEDLGASSKSVEDFKGLVDGFKDSYGGHVFQTVADAKLWITQKFTGDETGFAGWVRDKQKITNQIRNDLFGSALTAPEKIEFQKSEVAITDSPAVIRAGLKKQLAIATKASNKIVQAYLLGNGDKSQIRAAVGETAWNLATNVKDKTKQPKPDTKVETQESEIYIRYVDGAAVLFDSSGKRIGEGAK